MERENPIKTFLAGRPFGESRIWRSNKKNLQPTRRYRLVHKIVTAIDEKDDDKK